MKYDDMSWAAVVVGGVARKGGVGVSGMVARWVCAHPW